MSYLPEGVSFEERVQDYFLAVRGSGLMLSALDVELLSEWSRSGVPFEVVARGIRRSAERALFDARPGEPILRSLRACRRQVEAEIGRHRSRAAGQHEKKRESWEVERKKALSKLLAGARGSRAEGVPEPRLERALDRLGVLIEACEPTPDALSRLEDAVPVALCRALPFLERRDVWREAVRRVAESGASSRVARLLGRRVRLAAALSRHLRLV